MNRLLVVGASRAGLRAVTEARALGYAGAITLVGAEDHLPYDRPPLSKDLLEPGELSTAHLLPDSEELVDVHGVDLRLATTATELDVDGHVVRVKDADGVETELGYDALLVATGARARNVSGADRLAGVEVLRTLDDALQIRAALDRGARTVVVGAGFVGAEVASAAVRRGLTPVIVEAAPMPLVRALGESTGAALVRLHARHGTTLLCGVGVDKFIGANRVEAVRLSDGRELPADLVVVGVGADPCTDWLADSGLILNDGLVCDSLLRAGPEVWAAGDVARWEHTGLGRTLRLENWTNAGDQAAHAVANLLDPDAATAYETVPYFWSDWYGERIQFAGLPVGEPEVVIGGWDEDSVLALYRDGDRLAGALAVNRRGDIMKFRAQLARNGTYATALELAEQRRRTTAISA